MRIMLRPSEAPPIRKRATMKMVRLSTRRKFENSDEEEEYAETVKQKKKELIKENVGKVKKDKWYIIKVSNVFYQQWKLFIILMNFVSCFIYAYYATFLELLNDAENATFLYYDMFFQTIFVM